MGMGRERARRAGQGGQEGREKNVDEGGTFSVQHEGGLGRECVGGRGEEGSGRMRGDGGKRQARLAGSVRTCAYTHACGVSTQAASFPFPSSPLPHHPSPSLLLPCPLALPPHPPLCFAQSPFFQGETKHSVADCSLPPSPSDDDDRTHEKKNPNRWAAALRNWRGSLSPPSPVHPPPPRSDCTTLPPCVNSLLCVPPPPPLAHLSKHQHSHTTLPFSANLAQIHLFPTPPPHKPFFVCVSPDFPSRHHNHYFFSSTHNPQFLIIFLPFFCCAILLELCYPRSEHLRERPCPCPVPLHFCSPVLRSKKTNKHTHSNSNPTKKSKNKATTVAIARRTTNESN